MYEHQVMLVTSLSHRIIITDTKGILPYLRNGIKTYRFSIAWTRILPNGTGKVNEKGIEFYNNVIDECLKYNIEPVVTMYRTVTILPRRKGWLV